MATEAKIKVEEIEGIEDLLAKVLIERRGEIFGAYAQDIEALRRSPAGVAIRLEGRVERLEEMVGEIRAAMATKEDVERLERRLDGLEERMATNFRWFGKGSPEFELWAGGFPGTNSSPAVLKLTLSR